MEPRPVLLGPGLGWGMGRNPTLCRPGDRLGLLGKLHLLWRTLVSNFLRVIWGRRFRICF